MHNRQGLRTHRGGAAQELDQENALGKAQATCKSRCKTRRTNSDLSHRFLVGYMRKGQNNANGLGGKKLKSTVSTPYRFSTPTSLEG